MPKDVNKSSKAVIALCVGVCIAALFGAAYLFLRRIPGEITLEVREVRLGVEHAGRQGDDSLLGHLAKAVTSEVRADVQIAVDNPSVLPAVVENLHWVVAIGGVEVGRGGVRAGTDEQEIAAGGISYIETETRIPVTRLAHLAVRGRGTDVRIWGQAVVRVMGFSVVQDFEADGAQVLRGGSLDQLLTR